MQKMDLDNGFKQEEQVLNKILNRQSRTISSSIRKNIIDNYWKRRETEFLRSMNLTLGK